MHRIDGPGATVDNKFTEEIPETGTPATDVTDDWLTAIQEEICAVIEAAGIVLDKPTNNQLLQAIHAMADTGAPVTLAVESTLTAAHGQIYVNPPVDTVLLLHLPAYATIAANKRYRIKNIGLGTARVDAVDAKTIDGLAQLDITPNEKIGIGKDGVNWQTT